MQPIPLTGRARPPGRLVHPGTAHGDRPRLLAVIDDRGTVGSSSSSRRLAPDRAEPSDAPVGGSDYGSPESGRRRRQRSSSPGPPRPPGRALPLRSRWLGEPTVLTHHNDDLVAQLDLNPAESFTFSGADGDEVQGWLVRPPGFDETKKYPVLFLIHGGPQGSWHD